MNKVFEAGLDFILGITFVIGFSHAFMTHGCVVQRTAPLPLTQRPLACSAASLSSLLLTLETFQSPRVRKCRETLLACDFS